MVYNGNEASKNRLALLKQEITELDLKPHLVIILVGEDTASRIYVEKKCLAGEEIGATVEVLKFPEDVEVAELSRQIKNLNQEKEVHGIIVQLPLPRWLDK